VASCIAILAAVGLLLLFSGFRTLEGTTLRGTWYWAAATLFCLGVTELPIALYALPDSNWVDPLRFTMVLSTFCPIMSQMGAKRPQDQAWHFIVFSLWGVLALPAANAYFLDEPLQLHSIRGWFLWLLIALGTSNLLPTRFGLSATLIGAGQAVLLCGYLPLLHRPLEAWGTLIGTTLIVAAIGIARLQANRSPKSVKPMDLLWIDFRNHYGTLWGLRVSERFNASAQMYQWPVHLTWWGFRRDKENKLTGKQAAAMLQNLKNLLRRFVSPEWIERRLEYESSDSNADTSANPQSANLESANPESASPESANSESARQATGSDDSISAAPDSGAPDSDRK
jgi:hypothetical protein